MSFVETKVSWLDAQLPNVELGIRKYTRKRIEDAAVKYMNPAREIFGFMKPMSKDAAIEHVLDKMENGGWERDEWWIGAKYRQLMSELSGIRALTYTREPDARVLLNSQHMDFINTNLSWAETEYEPYF